jgi:peptide deformylase
MAVRKIITLPDQVLRKKARKVTDFGPELQKLLDDMVETMREAPGVGLAAPQVAVPLRVIVVEYGEEEGDGGEEGPPPKLFTLVNPEITRFSQETESGTEGCLSIPGFLGDVVRPNAITVKGQNRRGKPVRLKVDGWMARIFQHEIDHLDGVLFIDRAEKVWKHEGEARQVAIAD